MVTPNELEQLVSPARFSTFMTLANGNRDLAAELYVWTGDISGALFTDFRTLEVVFRNCIDQAITAHVATTAPSITDWLWDSSWIPAAGHWWDQGAENAIRIGGRHAGGRNAPHGAVIAELTFGFWRYMLAGRYEESFWNTALDAAFTGIPGHAPGDRRQTLEQAVINLHGLRNRLAHHEPIAKPWTRRVPGGNRQTFSLDQQYDDLVRVLEWTAPNHASDLLVTSSVRTLLASRPH